MLVAALIEAGHEVEMVTLPYVWTAGRSALLQALAWRLVDLDVAGSGASADLVIATKYPAYLIRHPNKVAWIFHQQREVYDLHPTRFGEFSLAAEDRNLRQALVETDLQGLTETRALFSNSTNVATRLREYCGFEARPLYAPPKLHKELRSGPYDDYLFYVGRLDRIKRLDLTIRGLAMTRSPAKLLIAGRGPERQALEELVEELGLQARVSFLGYVSDEEVVQLYARCCAVVLTPHDEDYGFTTLEAFLAAKPVITTTDAGGVLEFVEDGVTGFVVAADAAAIAEKVDELYRDRALCEALGLAGLSRVRERASWPAAIAALTETLG